MLEEELEKTLNVCEIYRTFSGEGKTKGLPVGVVRLVGCNLRCTYCDSKYAYEQLSGKEPSTIIDIIETLENRLQCDRMLLTGGEPLLQENSLILLRAWLEVTDRDVRSELVYLKERRSVIIETNGSLSIEPYMLGDSHPTAISVCMDVKCPSSGMLHRMHWPNMKVIRRNVDEVKFVIGDRQDFEFAVKTVQDFDLSDTCAVFSPVWGKLALDHLADWMLEAKVDARFSPQLHKIVWGSQRRR